MPLDGVGRYQLHVLYVTVFVDTVGFGLGIPVLPYFALSFRPPATPAQLGIMTAGFNIGSLFGNYFLCSLSDRIGRKPVLCVCLFATSICYTVLTVVSSAEQLILVRFFSGFFSGTVACAKAYAADCTDEKERAPCLANVNVAMALSIVFGPALGGLCSLVSISFAFQVMAVVSMLNAIAGFILLAETPKQISPHPVTDAAGNQPRMGIVEVLRAQPMILAVVMSSGLQYLAYSSQESLGALLFLMQYGIETSTYAGMTALGGIVYVLTMKVAFMRVYNQIGGKRTAQLGHVFRGIGYAMLALGSEPWCAFLALVCMGLGGLITPANDTTLSLLTSSSSRGAVQGLNMAVAAGARAFGPLLAVPLFQTNYALPFLASACLQPLATLTLEMLREPSAPTEPPMEVEQGEMMPSVLDSLPSADPGSTRPVACKFTPKSRTLSADGVTRRMLLEPLCPQDGQRAVRRATSL